MILRSVFLIVSFDIFRTLCDFVKIILDNTTDLAQCSAHSPHVKRASCLQGYSVRMGNVSALKIVCLPLKEGANVHEQMSVLFDEM